MRYRALTVVLSVVATVWIVAGAWPGDSWLALPSAGSYLSDPPITDEPATEEPP